MLLLAVALALAGGTSRSDSPAQAIARLAALAAIVVSLLPLDLTPLIRHARLLMGVAIAWLLVGVQLIPMPPSWWAALPGHAIYAQIAALSGETVWRPLSLVPDLTMNAFWALLPGTAVAIAVLFLDVRSRGRLALALVALATASAVLGLMQLASGGMSLHLYAASTSDSPVGLFGNPNHQAAFLAASLPGLGATVGLRLRNARSVRLLAILASSATLLLLLTVLLTGSRMGLALAIIGVVGGLVAFRAGGGRLAGSRRQRRIAAIALGLVLAGLVSGAALKGGAIARLRATDRMNEIRLRALPSFVTTAQAYMPLGAGFGTFDPVYRRFEPDDLLSTVYLNQAHDEPVQLAIEGGVPALALLALFLAWWLRAAWRILRWPMRRSRRRALAIAAVFGSGVLMASSLVDYPLRTPLAAMIFVLACIEMSRGAAAAADAREGSEGALHQLDFSRRGVESL